MNKIDNASEPINYKELKIKYFNSFYPINPKKEEKQRLKN